MALSRTLPEQVYYFVKHTILSGDLRAGERLNEVKLAERLEMSRGPVREGLQKLILEGLLERIPRRGVFVSQLDAKQLRELNELREALEFQALRLIFRRGVAEVEEELQWLRRSTRPGEIDTDTYSFELDLHQRLLELSSNETLAKVGESVNSRLKLSRMLSGAPRVRAKEAWEEHDTILAAILDNDEAGALEAMRRHLELAGCSMLQMTEVEAQRDEPACEERKGSR